MSNLYASTNIIKVIKSRRMRWEGHVAGMGEMKNAHKVLVGKLERKRPLGRLRRRGEDNIRKDSKEIDWEGVDWIHLALSRGKWRAVSNTVMNLRFP